MWQLSTSGCCHIPGNKTGKATSLMPQVLLWILQQTLIGSTCLYWYIASLISGCSWAATLQLTINTHVCDVTYCQWELKWAMVKIQSAVPWTHKRRLPTIALLPSIKGPCHQQTPVTSRPSYMFSAESDNITTCLIKKANIRVCIVQIQEAHAEVEEARKTLEVSMCLHVSV